MNGSSLRHSITCTWLRIGLAPLATLLVMLACASPPQPGHHPAHFRRHQAEPGGVQRPIGATPSLDLSTLSDLETLIPALAERRVVLIGETHDRLEHHLIQLEIIRGLHAIHPKLAIGMEAFQQPFQPPLDDYLAGELSERELLRQTEYYRRWRFDFRLYQPILEYAREHRLPLVALNLPVELTRKVGERGIDGLSDEERAEIPDQIDRSDPEYQRRLEEVFERHPKREGSSFDRFLEVQLLWDEGMAERAADFLEAHPDYRMVILAGSGHVAHGSGIARRLVRGNPVSTAIVLAGWEGALEPGLGDYLLLPQERQLPAAGRIGAFLDEGEGRLEVSSCTPGSACQKAGLESGDQILSVEGQPVTSMEDLKLMMWDKSPGDRITVEIRRSRWLSGARQLTREVVLQ
jgi:uncharacterized iron-regulated protein